MSEVGLLRFSILSCYPCFLQRSARHVIARSGSARRPLVWHVSVVLLENPCHLMLNSRRIFFCGV